MDFLIDEFIKSYKSQEGIAGLNRDELDTYIANEIIDENGKVLIEIPEPKFYTNAVRESIYRYRSKNKEGYNKLCRDYYHNKMQDPAARAFHNERCKEYNRRARLRRKKMEAGKSKEPPSFTVSFA